MSTTSSPVTVVTEMYAAFGRGDVPGVLSRLHPEVRWGLNADGAAPGALATPLFRQFNGPADVGNFFAIIGQELEFHVFEPRLVASSENEVVMRVTIETTVRATKCRLRTESIHLFTFDGSGQLAKFREYTDTLAIAGAWGTVRSTH